MAYISLDSGLPEVDWKSPLEPAWSLYQLMLLREPHELLKAQMILTNNQMNMASQETAVSLGIGGQATVPIFLTWDPYAIDEYADRRGKPVTTETRVNSLTERLTGVKYFDMHEKAGIKDRGKWMKELFPLEEITPKTLDPDSTRGKRARKTDVDKVIVAMIRSISSALYPRSVYLPPKAELKTWLGPGHRLMGIDFRSFANNLDELQRLIYEAYQANPPVGVAQHIAGLAMLEKNEGKPKLAEKPNRSFPGMRTRINSRTSLQYLLDVRTTKYREERVMTLYTTPAACALRHFVHIEGYEPEDYMAMNSVLHSMYSGYGSPTFANWLHARDINETILMALGTGIRRSDPLHGLEENFFMHMWDWALVFGLQQARAVPQSETIDIRLDTNELQGYKKLEQYMANFVDVPGYGTKSDPHFIMPTNYVPSDCFMWPCAVRSKKHKKDWPDYINTWEWAEGYTFPNTKPATISGENSLNIPFDENTAKTWYKLSFTSDARWGKTVIGQSKRPLLYWEFPVMPLYYTDEQQTNESRKLAWLLGLFCYTGATLKDGYRVQPFFKLLRGVRGKVRLWVDSRGEARFVRTDAQGRVVLDDEGQPIMEDKTIPTDSTMSEDGLPGMAIREKPSSFDKPPVVSIDPSKDGEEEETAEDDQGKVE